MKRQQSQRQLPALPKTQVPSVSQRAVVKRMAWLPDLWRGAPLSSAPKARRGLMLGGAIAGAAMLMAVGANLLFGADWVAARVAAELKEKTGTELSMNGPARLSFLPGPQVVISDATLTAPRERTGSLELAIATLTIDLDFADFLRGAIEAERVVLERPVLTLRGREARASDAASHLRTLRYARAELGGGISEQHRELRIDDLQIVDGTVVFGSLGRGIERRIEHIHARVSLPALRAPMVGQGTFEWNREHADFSFEFATPAELRAKRPARLQLAIDTGAAATRFDGSVRIEPEFSGEGRLSSKARSVPALLAWLRGSNQASPATGEGEFDGRLTWSKTKITVSEARFAGAHLRGGGEAVVSYGADRPHVRAAIALDHLDLTPFLGDETDENRPDRLDMVGRDGAPRRTADWFSKPGEPGGSAVSAYADRFPLAGQRTLSLAERMPDDELARARKPQVPKPARMVEPLPFDADVNLNVREAHFKQVEAGPGALGIDFDDGVLKATLNGLALYDGTAGGTLTMDTRRALPRFEGEFRLEGIQTRPLLGDAVGFTMVSGRTKLRLSVAGEGKDARAIKSSLRGSGAFVTSDGAIEGVDMTAFIRALGKGEVDLRQGQDARTAFSNLGGSFTIDRGIARTSNLKMKSALLSVRGEGDVDLRNDSLQFSVTPEIVAGPEGRGGANDLAGLSVPVRVEGPLDRPHVRPEISAVFANPQNASKAVKRIGAALREKFKGRPIGEFIGRLLGGDAVGDAAPQALAPALPAAPQGAGPNGQVDR